MKKQLKINVVCIKNDYFVVQKEFCDENGIDKIRLRRMLKTIGLEGHKFLNLIVYPINEFNEAIETLQRIERLPYLKNNEKNNENDDE
jgi:hypothetical protein